MIPFFLSLPHSHAIVESFESKSTAIVSTLFKINLQNIHIVFFPSQLIVTSFFCMSWFFCSAFFFLPTFLSLVFWKCICYSVVNVYSLGTSLKRNRFICSCCFNSINGVWLIHTLPWNVPPVAFTSLHQNTTNWSVIASLVEIVWV